MGVRGSCWERSWGRNEKQTPSPGKLGARNNTPQHIHNKTTRTQYNVHTKPQKLLARLCGTADVMSPWKAQGKTGETEEQNDTMLFCPGADFAFLIPPIFKGLNFCIWAPVC